MRANEVMKLLGISRPTLNRWVKKGIIKVRKLPNGRYEYDDKSVYEMLLRKTGRDLERKTIIYARVSTQKQKTDLDNQIKTLKQFCIAKGWKIDGIYKDVASALDFDKRKEFNRLVEEVMNYQIERVVIMRKDRLTRIGWKFFENFFRKFGTEIVVVEDVIDEKTDKEEIIEEIITLLHSFAMKFYSNRRKVRKKVEEMLSEGKAG